VESLALAFTGGWASGVNAYLVVLVLGIADRVGDLEQVPDALGRWDVLTVAGFMFAMEFVADKVPYVDSTWDAISTVIRPTVGAVIGVLVAGDASSLDQAVLGVVGGGTALASHLVKAGSRLAINTSPEPVTNIGIVIAWFAVSGSDAAGVPFDAGSAEPRSPTRRGSKASRRFGCGQARPSRRWRRRGMILHMMSSRRTTCWSSASVRPDSCSVSCSPAPV
jgi:hypothetical protein